MWLAHDWEEEEKEAVIIWKAILAVSLAHATVPTG